jgi:hypothetical protein
MTVASGPYQPIGENTLVMNYDVKNSVLYYNYDHDSINSIPQVVDDSVELYAGRRRDIAYHNSRYLLANGSFISFRGDKFFSTGEVTPFPYQNMGDDVRFYSYHSGTVYERGCSIKTYNGFYDTPKETLVHSEYTCSADYSIQNRNVVIPLIDFNVMGGYATITPDGLIHVMDFAADIPNFDHYNSFSIINEWVICFGYIDKDGEDHDVISSYDLSYLKTDLIGISNAPRVIYLDRNLCFHRYSGTDFRLYKDGVLFYTYNQADSMCHYDFFRCGEYAVFYELNMGSGNGKIIVINLTDGTEIVYEKKGFWMEYFSANYLLVSEESNLFLYDVPNDDFIALKESGTFKKVNDDCFLLYSDTYVYLYNLSTRNSFEMRRIACFRQYLTPYAFLVEYKGEYYLLG